jgi:hypothetical protein
MYHKAIFCGCLMQTVRCGNRDGVAERCHGCLAIGSPVPRLNTNTKESWGSRMISRGAKIVGKRDTAAEVDKFKQ